MKTRRVALFGVLAALALPAAPAAALTGSATDTLSGTGLGTLSIGVSTPASAWSLFQPGSTATSSGALLLTSTDPNWTLTAQDAGAAATAGHPLAASANPLCAGSEASAGSSAASVKVTGITGIDSTVAGAFHAIGASPVVVAQPATSALPVAAVTGLTSYSLPIGAGETIATGCPYSMTVTYTLASS